LGSGVEKAMNKYNNRSVLPEPKPPLPVKEQSSI
jgi:hypothetical protein